MILLVFLDTNAVSYTHPRLKNASAQADTHSTHIPVQTQAAVFIEHSVLNIHLKFDCGACLQGFWFKGHF